MRGNAGRLATVLASRDRAEWLAVLEHDQTCVTPVRSASDALADPDLRSRGVVSEVALADGSTVLLGRPVAWLPEPAGGPPAAPGLGADGDAVLRRLGRDPLAARSRGALG